MITESEVLAQETQQKYIDWELIAQIKNNSGQTSIGFAGPINGVSNGVFISGGGANFPDKMPWEGGKKYYSDTLHVLEKRADKYIWKDKIYLMPEPIAYAGNTVTSKGIVYVGGENAKGISAKAHLITWDSTENEVKINDLPNLPLALTNVAVCQLDDVVYAIGGDGATSSSNSVFCLDLKQNNLSWIALPNLPVALANATAIVQYNENGEKSVYVIGGRSKNKSGISDLHSSVFNYQSSKKTWTTKAQISKGQNISNLSAASGVAIGKHHILICGGDNGLVFHQIETLLSKIIGASNEEEKAKYTNAKNDLVIHHKGFDKSILLYNTKADTWQKIGELPFLTPVTTTAAKWGDKIILSNGEIKPGIRTANVMLGIIH